MRKGKADVVQSTLRLPRALWVRINHIAASKNLSMQQAVQEAIVEYCRREAEPKKGGK
jgi:predicted DNA-binding ribbon-helix-helix protein